MTTPFLRRTTLTALVFAALAGPALAETTPPAQPNEPGQRMEHRRDRGDRLNMQPRMHMRGR